MGAISKESTKAERFAREYSQRQREAERLVDREVFGAVIGANGYTTVDEASRLLELLALEPGERLLDLGSGRGWPGMYLANESGCSVTLTDVPTAALRDTLSDAARPNGPRTGTGAGAARCCAAAADGRALPFRPQTFDAVVHADVLC